MNQFFEKLTSGVPPVAADWEAFLQDAHRDEPSMTPDTYHVCKTKEGLTSYQMLVNSLEGLEHKNLDILDLACGDGCLINSLKEFRTYTGMDMSEGGLEVARKNFSGWLDVEFVQARAQEMSLESESMDAVLCHMAIMLMSPVEPVIREISRVLKPGGVFSAVINADATENDFDTKMRKVIWGFYRNEFPNIAPARETGDLRLYEGDKLQELFSVGKFAPKIEITDFSVEMKFNEDEFWQSHRTLYFISMLPEDLKAKLKVQLLELHRSLADANGILTFNHPMRRITVYKGQ